MQTESWAGDAGNMDTRPQDVPFGQLLQLGTAVLFALNADVSLEYGGDISQVRQASNCQTSSRWHTRLRSTKPDTESII